MVAQFDGGHLLDERVRLFRCEPEIRHPDLGHLPAALSLPRDSGGSARVLSTTGRWGEAEQQELKLIMAATFLMRW